LNKLPEVEIPVWWEPGTPGILDIGDISVFLGALIAFATISMVVSRALLKALRKVVNEEITIATEPIHPRANGGLSLADVARKTSSLEKQMKRLETQSIETRDLLIKVLSQSVIIPDTVPEEPQKTKRVSTLPTNSRSRKK
jgi:hypothetical protein